jgi:hypothetical protein
MFSLSQCQLGILHCALQKYILLHVRCLLIQLPEDAVSAAEVL